MAKTELLKIAKPILFNTDMVKAILDGRKTVTRRVVNPQIETFGKAFAYKGALCSMDWVTKQSRYKIGDILYVRETWSPVWVRPKRYQYKATPEVSENTPIKWRPSIHMPKEAARIFLKVTDVRVERLQDITIPQAKDEGVTCDCLDNEENVCYKGNVGHFQDLWNSTIKKQDLDKYGWDANPWVWVYEFERVECDENNERN